MFTKLFVLILIGAFLLVKVNNAGSYDFVKLNPPATDPKILKSPCNIDFFYSNSFKKKENKSCLKRYYINNSSFVCVCNAQYCDEPEPVGEIQPGKFVVYMSTPSNDRFTRITQRFTNKLKKKHCKQKRLQILFDPKSDVKQTIFGFGGAFTDAAGINLNSLSDGARQKLLEAYFADSGIGYTIGRVPIASCDFSTREYSYLDKSNDFDLQSFELADEDLKDKIPFILKALNLSHGKLKLFASPWSAPGWMKTTGRMKGGGQLKGEFNGKYYQTYAKYFVKFFENYWRRGVQFWALTIENEPSFGLDKNYSFQAMFLSPKMQRDFAYELLVPALKSSMSSANIKIMAHDDQRDKVLNSAKDIYEDEKKAQAIDGLAFHWYSRSNYTPLTEAHNLNPGKFILATEACTGFSAKDSNVLLGDWGRGLEYGFDIINDLLNWSIGWTDWNLALDLGGGPNWVKNFVDAPIIVDAKEDEFYKQPMFYFLGHFSKFVPRGSVVLNTQIDAIYSNKIAINEVSHINFKTPDNTYVTVLISKAKRNSYEVVLKDMRSSAKYAVLNVTPGAILTVLWR